MTRAIPALLEGIPMNDAAHMGAACRANVQFSFLVAAHGQFCETAAQNTALASFARAGRFELTGCYVFGEILYGRNVFLNELADCVHGLTAWIVKPLPWTRPLENEIGRSE